MFDPAKNSQTDTACGSTDAIICVHGLWMRGPELALLRRRLQRNLGFRAHQFSYRSLVGGLDHHMLNLRSRINALGVEQVHLVGHSLGGVLALQTLQRYPDLPVGRVVCLGSPLVDSRAGRALCRHGLGRRMVGQTLIQAIFETPLGAWNGRAEVGVIAGTRPLGLGMLVAKLDRPHDGDVSSAETQLPGITAHIEMPVNHFGLVFSTPVVAQVANFLRDGNFLPN